MWPFRRRHPEILPTLPAHGPREREAEEALKRSEQKAAVMDVLSRRADLLADELRRALGGSR
jgi:hypothetical protein